MYRPNEAKVRNLKTKDYLGKARLVAASDRSNAFTGFAGSEMKNVSARFFDFLFRLLIVAQQAKAEAKDDRPTENLSFAATNLVKPGLQSRRQQSEPPTNRNNAFPPTPPPENDRGPSRGASVRSAGQRPNVGKLSIQTQESSRRYEKATSPQERTKQHSRSASANPTRGFSTREPPRRQRAIEEESPYGDEAYDMYDGPRGSKQSRSRQQRYDDEDDGSDYEYGSFDEGEFEMVSSVRRGPGSVSRPSRAASRRPDVRKIRVKVHSDDVRYIMVGTSVEFSDFVDRIRDKFGLRRRFKIKMKDEDVPDDMITMGDQDDLDVAIQSAKSQAKRQRLDVGKMEVSLSFQGL